MDENYIITVKHLFAQYSYVGNFEVELMCNLETVELDIQSHVMSHTYPKENLLKWG